MSQEKCKIGQKKTFLIIPRNGCPQLTQKSPHLAPQAVELNLEKTSDNFLFHFNFSESRIKTMEVYLSQSIF